MEYPEIGPYDPNVAPVSGDILIYDDGTAHFPGGDPGYPMPSDGFVPATEHYTESYGEPEFQETHSILADGGEHFGVSAIAFDLQEELLWMGNQGGHVTSYYGQEMQKYTSFQVHASQEVRHIHTFDDGILALTQSSLRCQMRRGIPIFTHSSDNMEEMQTLLQISPETLLMGGHQDKLIEFNFARGEETNVLNVGENGCAILRQHSRYICAGDPAGKVDLRDPSTLKVEHTLETHSGSLSDFDVHGNLLVTCGFSNRQGNMAVDRILMVYDLRMMRAVTPIQVMLDPLLLRFLPSISSRICTVSALGQMQLVDTVALSQPNLCLYQINTGGSMCLTFDVSPSCQCLAFGDSGGTIHFFSSNPQAMFNSYSRETEFADPVDTLPSISIHDELTPLSSIAVAVCQGTLLSDWPEQFSKKAYRRTPPIDPEILRTMKMVGTIGYAPNPGTCRRNQVPYKMEKRRSQKPLFPDSQHGKGSDSTCIAIPKRYRKIEVKYSRLGVDDFDFDQYNKTSFSGLEATLPNSYSNGMLQMLFYTDEMRIVLKSHLCPKEFCLACELGFLFHMLETSQGFPCQANNFLRAFRTIPEASALGLILADQTESKKKTNLAHLIQSWNRFILHQLHYEFLDARKRQQQRESQALTENILFRTFPNTFIETYAHAVQKQIGMENVLPEPIEVLPEVKEEQEDAPSTEESTPNSAENQEEETDISKLCGMKQLNINRCVKCGEEHSKETVLLLCNLIYPSLKSSGKNKEYSFCDVLLRSLCPEQTTPAWCDKCEKYQPTTQSRRLQTLPNFLSINCGLDNQQDRVFWQTQMDFIIQKVADQNQEASSIPPNTKLCRYGSNCSRPGCRFFHGRTGETQTASNSHLYFSYSWLPLHIQIDLLSDGMLNIKKISQTETNSKKEEESKDGKEEEEGAKKEEPKAEVNQSVVYDLCGVICHITDPQHPDKKNLVSFVNVAPSYHERSMGSPVSQWYIFNDFSIAPVPPQEAVWFSFDWKIPCVLYWRNRNMPKDVISPMKNPLTVDVFCEDNSLAQNTGTKLITFTPLKSDEMPSPGDVVAMDAEFVTLNQEESELRSDGKLSTIKPSQLSVARITCIRGQGPLEGTAFIDDYISTQEQVVDYLTKFSGIKPGDLDANFSSKHLTTLKSTYLKLRFLVDIGVKFVGHGLKNDFRVINLVVPSEQVIDTVLLFHLPHHRMVSLRFLAWHFLGVKIQSVTHDSIEDARAALQLYKRYLQLEADGQVTPALKQLYEVGKKLQWKVPDTEND